MAEQVASRLTGHSGRVGLASALTASGASTTDGMLAVTTVSARPPSAAPHFNPERFMINGSTVLILLGSIATIVLVAIVLVRQSRGFDTAAKTVRDELKAGREEAQQAARASARGTWRELKGRQ